MIRLLPSRRGGPIQVEPISVFERFHKGMNVPEWAAYQQQLQQLQQAAAQQVQAANANAAALAADAAASGPMPSTTTTSGQVRTRAQHHARRIIRAGRLLTDAGRHDTAAAACCGGHAS